MTTVWLDTLARAHIEREALKRRLCETGGALFGWEGEERLVVACASGPGSRAKHRLRRFEPHRATTATAMRAVEAASEKRYSYLGSWHTHPLSGPSPSALDAETAGELAAQPDLLLPRPLLLILSTLWRARTVRPTEMRAWRWDATAARLQHIELLSCALEEALCPEQVLFGGGG